MSQVTDASPPSPAFKGLYRIGGVASITAAFLTVAEMIAFAFFPQPSTTTDWFILFQTDPIIGLLDFWGLELPMYGVFAVLFLALCVVLRRANRSAMAIALTLALLGIAVFFATNNPFSMLSLSRQYSAATTDVSRTAALAAGQALLVNTNQRVIGGFNTALFLVSIAGLVCSSLMRRAPSFRRSTANIGVLAFALSLADYIRQALTSSAVIAVLLILPAAVLLVVWLVLVGRRLRQLGQPGV
jgi:hypothetical protein